jgi:hypothetical protein
LKGLEAKLKDVPVMNVVDKWFLYKFGFGRIQNAVIYIGEKNLDSRLAVLRSN